MERNNEQSISPNHSRREIYRRRETRKSTYRFRSRSQNRSDSPLSPRRRTPISPRRRLPISPRRRSSISPRRRSPISPRYRSPTSPRYRSPTSPRYRSSISPKYRSPISLRYRSQHRTDNGKPPEPTEPYSQTLCVSSIHPEASDELVKNTLLEKFTKFDVVNVKIQRNLGKRIAFAIFENYDDAQKAKQSRVSIYDRAVVIEKAYEVSELNSPHDNYRPHKEHHRQSQILYSRDRLLSSKPYYEKYYGSPEHYEQPNGYGYSLPEQSTSYHNNKYFERTEHPSRENSFLYLSQENGQPSNNNYRKALKASGNKKYPSHLNHTLPENDPLASRTLFVGNLEHTISTEELTMVFGVFGVIEDIDIKRPPHEVSNSYAFICFQNLDMAYNAKVAVSGQFIGMFQCKIGYGKPLVTPVVWIGGLGPWTSITQLEREFDRFGTIIKIKYKNGDSFAYIMYRRSNEAHAAVYRMRGFLLSDGIHRLRTGFGSINNFESTSSRQFMPDNYQASNFEIRNTSNSTPPFSLDGVSLREIANLSSKNWKSSVTLKSSQIPVNLHLVNGDEYVVNDLLLTKDGTNNFSITQKLKLEPEKLNAIKTKLQSGKPYAVLLALSDFESLKLVKDQSSLAKPLQNLENYLSQRNAAGICLISDENSKTKGELYCFPQCSFAKELLHQVYSNIKKHAKEECNLVILAISNND